MATLGELLRRTPIPDELYDSRVGELIYGNDDNYIKESEYYKQEAELIRLIYQAFYAGYEDDDEYEL